MLRLGFVNRVINRAPRLSSAFFFASSKAITQNAASSRLRRAARFPVTPSMVHKNDGDSVAAELEQPIMKRLPLV